MVERACVFFCPSEDFGRSYDSVRSKGLFAPAIGFQRYGHLGFLPIGLLTEHFSIATPIILQILLSFKSQWESRQES